MASARQAKISDLFKSTKLHVISNKSIESKSETDDTAKDENESTRRKEDLESDLDILRAFDLNPEFGPCSGITRLERWNRAQKFDLNPPMNVRQLIEFNILDRLYTECVWTEYNI